MADVCRDVEADIDRCSRDVRAFPGSQQRAHHSGRDEGGNRAAPYRVSRVQLRSFYRRSDRSVPGARLGEIFNPHVLFFVGAATIALAIVVLLAGGRHLGRIDAEESDVLRVGSDEPIPLGNDLPPGEAVNEAVKEELV
jgi:hypothetical protein